MDVPVTCDSDYIASDACAQLLQRGHDVIRLDNLCNSKPGVVPVITRTVSKRPLFIHGDIRDEALRAEKFYEHNIDVATHFAGFKTPGESGSKPLEHDDENVCRTLAMCAANGSQPIFSSSATVHGDRLTYWADATEADQTLGWLVSRSLQKMTDDTWHWSSRHPEGYPD